MPNSVQQFERAVLRPLWAAFIVVGVTWAVKGQWLWVGGCTLGLFYLGVIGSKLHPRQSATDLAEGPLEGPAAHIESERLEGAEKVWLVGQACTRVGLLVGASAAVLFVALLGWRWYFSIPLGYLIMMGVGASLKLTFKTTSRGR